VPTSVLLAVLAAAGLLALAPALVRRYDATERLAAERATTTARVLSRRRRRRTVPGSVPINPPRLLLRPRLERAASGRGRGRQAARQGVLPSSVSSSASGLSARRRRGLGRTAATIALGRRRRVFLALVLLNLAELAGVLLVGPGFWTGFAVSLLVLVADMIYLRRSAVRSQRRRRAELRRAGWVAAQQAAVRLEHTRRQLARSEASRRAAADREAARRDSALRATDHVERYAPRPSGGLGSDADVYPPQAASATGTESLLGLRESLSSQFDVGRGGRSSSDGGRRGRGGVDRESPGRDRDSPGRLGHDRRASGRGDLDPGGREGADQSDRSGRGRNRRRWRPR
jgi:predicted small integral membrane protein